MHIKYVKKYIKFIIYGVILILKNDKAVFIKMLQYIDFNVNVFLNFSLNILTLTYFWRIIINNFFFDILF